MAGRPSTSSSGFCELEHDIDVEAINILLQSGNAEVSETAPSEVLSGFRNVKHVCGEMLPGIQCTRCKAVYKYNKRSSSTVHLKKHQEKCIPPNQLSMDGFLKRSRTILPRTEREGVVKSLAAMCYKDLRPFSSVEGRGFADVCRAMISIGARFGQVSPEDILPSRKTVQRRVVELANENKKKALAFMNQNLERFGGFGVTTDMWSDRFRQVAYISLTIHGLTEDEDGLRMKSFVLAVSGYGTKRKDGEQIREKIFQLFQDVGIDRNTLKRVIFLSDSGPNVKCALKVFQWIPCAAHMLNLVMQGMFLEDPNANLDDFDDELDNADLSPSIRRPVECIIAVKKLVTYIKKSGLNQNLKKGVKQEVETRWNSLLGMLFSVDEAWEDIAGVLPQDKLDLFGAVDRTVLKDLVRLLGFPKEVSEKMEGERNPTLQNIILWQKKLENHFSDNPFDPPHMSVNTKAKQGKGGCTRVLSSRLSRHERREVASKMLYFCLSFVGCGDAEDRSASNGCHRKMSANGHLPPSGAIVTEHDGAHLVSRIQNQRTTQEVTKVTRVIREIHHVPVNYDEHGGYHPDMSHDSSFSGGGPPPHPDGRAIVYENLLEDVMGVENPMVVAKNMLKESPSRFLDCQLVPSGGERKSRIDSIGEKRNSMSGISYRTAKALMPYIFRNIEVDVMNAASKRRPRASSSSLRHSPSRVSVTVGYIQSLPKSNGGSVGVFAEEFGRLCLVPYQCVQAIPCNGEYQLIKGWRRMSELESEIGNSAPAAGSRFTFDFSFERNRGRRARASSPSSRTFRRRYSSDSSSSPSEAVVEEDSVFYSSAEEETNLQNRSPYPPLPSSTSPRKTILSSSCSAIEKRNSSSSRKNSVTFNLEMDLKEVRQVFLVARHPPCVRGATMSWSHVTEDRTLRGKNSRESIGKDSGIPESLDEELRIDSESKAGASNPERNSSSELEDSSTEIESVTTADTGASSVNVVGLMRRRRRRVLASDGDDEDDEDGDLPRTREARPPTKVLASPANTLSTPIARSHASSRSTTPIPDGARNYPRHTRPFHDYGPRRRRGGGSRWRGRLDNGQAYRMPRPPHPPPPPGESFQQEYPSAYPTAPMGPPTVTHPVMSSVTPGIYLNESTRRMLTHMAIERWETSDLYQPPLFTNASNCFSYFPMPSNCSTPPVLEGFSPSFHLPSAHAFPPMVLPIGPNVTFSGEPGCAYQPPAFVRPPRSRQPWVPPKQPRISFKEQE
ncbi:unnamed protein product, partial [Cyprideis torosa]